MKKTIIVTKKYKIDTRINLLVAIMKSAEASMIAIAVSNDVLLHHMQQKVHSPKSRRTPPVIKSPVFVVD